VTCHELRRVDPLMVRRFTPTITPTTTNDAFGGVFVLSDYEVEDVGLVTERLDYDEAVVDCSNRIFQITTAMMMAPDREMALTCFPSRRWRNFRTGQNIDRWPDADHPLLYLGNPIRLFKTADGVIHVERSPEFLIKTGMELGF
jgi:hypothetical protein